MRTAGYVPRRGRHPGDQAQTPFGDFGRWMASTSKSGAENFRPAGSQRGRKTTTFRMLCGLLPPSAGQLDVAGYDLRHANGSGATAHRLYVAEVLLYGNLSAVQNLEFFASAYGLTRGAPARRASTGHSANSN